MQKESIYKIIEDYFTDKPVKKVFVFGSFSKNIHNKNSDIDLILNMEKPVGLFAIGKYMADLEVLTNHKIDIATQNSISPEFFQIIKNDLKILYSA